MIPICTLFLTLGVNARDYTTARTKGNSPQATKARSGWRSIGHNQLQHLIFVQHVFQQGLNAGVFIFHQRGQLTDREILHRLRDCLHPRDDDRDWASRTKRNAAWARVRSGVTKKRAFSASLAPQKGEEFWWPFRAHVTLAKRGRSGVFAGQHAIGEGLADNQANVMLLGERKSSRGS